MRIDETDYAWAAGIIDGEGTIGMTRNRVGTNRRATESFQVRISVRMTHKQTVKKLHALFGGTFKLARAVYSLRHNDCFEWYVGDLKTVEVLNKIRTHLVTKKKQANLILRFRSTCFDRPRGSRCPSFLVARRRRYFERLKNLNKRGK